jgi:hypothetical protein
LRDITTMTLCLTQLQNNRAFPASLKVRF